jgi:uncharacterized protein
MLITKDTSSDQYQIQSYSPGAVVINKMTYTHSVIISEHHLIPWDPQTFSELNRNHIQQVLDLNPELLLLGTGQHFTMPPQELLIDVYERQIGFESMDTKAACRTYSALRSEGRQVMVALIIK